MIHFSLFSGIGGFDLAAEWMGWDNYLSCEIEDFPNQVLNHYWPEAYHHRDIKNLDYDTIQNELTRRFGEWRTKPVVLTGGFPCQPYSQAGQRKGKADERHLWAEMLRLIHEIKPDFIVGENVFGLLNWNGGMVFDEVLTDLGSAGYDVTPLVIPAAAVNAPHGRDRVWFIAYSKSARTWEDIGGLRGKFNGRSEGLQKSGNATDTNGDGLNECNGKNEKHSSKEGKYAQRNFKQSHVNGNATNTNCFRQELPKKRHRFKNCQSLKSSQQLFDLQPQGWEKFPTEPPICSGDDGLPTELDGITFPKWRVESIKGYGNAIVPQVVYEIFKAIELAYSEITK